MRVAVLGAAGLMGSVIARDLDASPEIEDLVLLDRVRPPGGAVVDARDPQALMLAIEGCGMLVNAASYRVNLTAMDAALAANCSYVDLGGLYHVAARQYELHDAFAARGQLAVLGCGAGPGKTNVMAARAARELDEVHTVRCASAGYDESPPAGGLPVPYAIETLLDELTEAPMAVRDGRAVALEPLTPGGTIEFPEPVGRRESLFTLHSEVLTLGGSLGAPDVDFRLALAPAIEAALRDIVAGGPRPPVVRPSARTWSAQHVEVGGVRDGAPGTVTVTAVTRPHDGWGLGGGVVSTASVAAAVVRLYARGALGGLAGCLAPENALTPELLFPELEARGCEFAIHIAREEVTT